MAMPVLMTVRVLSNSHRPPLVLWKEA